MSASTHPLRFGDRTSFRAWTERQADGRWELHDGLAVLMAPERAVHARIKARAWAALDAAIAAAGLPCEAFVDGLTVEAGPRTDLVPDVVVQCGARVPNDDTVARDPVVIVEVLSPSTAYRDVSFKLDRYLGLPSVRHYLLVSADACRVVHHRRAEDGTIATAIHGGGTIVLHPPGLTLALPDLYRGTELAPDA